MMTPTPTQQFWNDYLSTLPEGHIHRTFPTPVAWSFGSDKETANKLVTLVMEGEKTATCSRYLGQNTVESSGPSIILNGDGTPMCVVDTYEIVIRRFEEVDPEFAFDEGEGDQSLDCWKEGHWNFFIEESKHEGYEVTKDMLLSCERFSLLYKSTENENFAYQGTSHNGGKPPRES